MAVWPGPCVWPCVGHLQQVSAGVPLVLYSSGCRFSSMHAYIGSGGDPSHWLPESCGDQGVWLHVAGSARCAYHMVHDAVMEAVEAGRDAIERAQRQGRDLVQHVEPCTQGGMLIVWP